MKISIGCDHGGYELKEQIIKGLKSWKWNGTDKLLFDIQDFGTNSKESVDYPDFAHKVCDSIESGESSYGILICGTGNGINMTANSHKGIRSALAWRRDVAKLARLHNDANVLALPGRILDYSEAWECVKEFLTTDFEGGRHTKRVDKIKVNY